MYRHITLAVLALTCAWPLWAAGLPPERAVSLDLNWLTPVIAENAWGQVERVEGCLRMSSRAGVVSPAFKVGLKYPISAADYPVMVLRYRAVNIGMVSEPVIGVELERDGAVVPAAKGSDLVQNGMVRELRRRLSGLPAGSMISGVRFALPPAVARMDLVELRFESASGVASAPPTRNVELSVVDEENRPVEGATVVVGPLERGNWTTAGESDAEGRLSIAAFTPAGKDGREQSIEAAVVQPGFAPVYVSAIKMLPDEMCVIVLKRTGELLADGTEEDDEYADDLDELDDEDIWGADTARYGRRSYGRRSRWGATSPAGQKMLSVATFKVLTVPTVKVMPINHQHMRVSDMPNAPQRQRALK